MHTISTDIGSHWSILFISGALILVGMMGNAWAGDKKIYNATLCMPKYQKNIVRYANGSIYNFDTRKNVEIVCPVIRDNTTNSNGVKAWGFVGRNMLANSLIFRCSLFSSDPLNMVAVDRHGGILKFNQGKRAFIDITYGPKKSLRGAISDYYLSCIIPKWERGKKPSSLASYYVEEY